MRIIILCLFCCLWAACKPYQLEGLPPERLHFGNKGGVSGQVREYILLLDNGQLLFKDPLTNELEKIGRWNRTDLEEVKSRLRSLPFDEPPTPSNFNTIVAYHTNGQLQALQWSSPKEAVDERVQSFFEHLMAEVRHLRKLE